MSAFLWGAATSPHQTEGNNVNSDWWQLENASGLLPERSGDACDSYHRYAEEMELLAAAGLNAYRFGIEWARVEPAPGQFSRAALAHYRRMIETAQALGLTPVITLHHFTHPAWFTDRGGWNQPGAEQLFTTYVARACTILGDVPWVCTVNEPNMVALMEGVRRSLQEGGTATDSLLAGDLPAPDTETGSRLVSAHHEAVAVLRKETDAAVGWTVAQQAFQAASPADEATLAEVNHVWEDLYLEAARGDDFVGSQAYTSRKVGPEGPIPAADSPDNTLTGWAYRPDALGLAVRHAWEVTGGVPVLVTENGIATRDDERRIAYTREALDHLRAAMADGVDVRGYLHWSALDNYEWGHWAPTFGLIAVDRETFERVPKPSLGWLGRVARGEPA